MYTYIKENMERKKIVEAEAKIKTKNIIFLHLNIIRMKKKCVCHYFFIEKDIIWI